MTETTEYIRDRLSIVEHVDIAGMLGDTISRLLSLSTEDPQEAQRQTAELTKGFGGDLDVLANKRERVRQEERSQYHRRLGGFKTDCVFLLGSVGRFEMALEQYSRKDIHRWRWSLLSYRLLLDRFLDALLAETEQGYDSQQLLERAAEPRGGDDFVSRTLVGHYATAARGALALPHWHRRQALEKLRTMLAWADGNRDDIRERLDGVRYRALTFDLGLMERLSMSTDSESGLLIAVLRSLETGELVKEMSDRRRTLAAIRNRFDNLRVLCKRAGARGDNAMPH